MPGWCARSIQARRPEQECRRIGVGIVGIGIGIGIVGIGIVGIIGTVDDAVAAGWIERIAVVRWVGLSDD